MASMALGLWKQWWGPKTLIECRWNSRAHRIPCKWVGSEVNYLTTEVPGSKKSLFGETWTGLSPVVGDSVAASQDVVVMCMANRRCVSRHRGPGDRFGCGQHGVCDDGKGV